MEQSISHTVFWTIKLVIIFPQLNISQEFQGAIEAKSWKED